MAQRFAVPLQAGTPLVVWELSPVVASDFPGFAVPAEDRVQYQFRNGFTQVGDLPCRQVMHAEMMGRPIVPPSFWLSAGYYAPVANRRVEFNGFEYTPTHKRRWCRTVVTAPHAGDFPFNLATCGGVRIWVNGAEAARFEPFERNAEHSTGIVLSLQAGDNAVWMHMEDLFERDTNWYVELTYTGEHALSASIEAQTNAGHIAVVRELSASVRPERDFFTNEPFALIFDRSADFDIPIAVRIVSHQHDRATFLDADVTLKAGETRLEICRSDEIPDGYHGVPLTFKVGDVTIDRPIDAVFFSRLKPSVAPASEVARKREALEFAAHFGDHRIGRVLAMFAVDDVDAVKVHSILDATLGSIEAREDCSDFVMVPLLWVWGLYGERIPAHLVARMRRAILEWRYWVDEPGNDVMWFWSENHTLCFHVSQYVAGSLFPNDIFICSGRTGLEQKRISEERLHLWFDAVEEHGFVEWNSAAYYPIDFIGIFGLYHWCDDGLKLRCKGLLDKLFLMTGLHTLSGVPAGSMGRAYDKELRAGPLTELAPFCRVGFGFGWLTPGVAALPLYGLSDYQAPKEAIRAALWEQSSGIEAQYTQGHEHNGKLKLFKSRDAMLSTVVEHSPGRPGHQQHVLDVRLSGHPMARLWINHPGEDDPWGVKRPSFWSGNGILPLVNQFGDTALMLYDLGKTPELGFVHAFAAADGLDEVLHRGQWLFARSGNGYAAIWASAPLDAVATGPTAHREYRAHNLKTGWIVRVGGGEKEADFAEFVAEMEANAPSYAAEPMRLSFNHPDLGVLALDWQGGASCQGAPVTFSALTVDPIIKWGSGADGR